MSIFERDSQMTKAMHKPDRRQFIGGSDARIIMGRDEKALLRLCREKRGGTLGRFRRILARLRDLLCQILIAILRLLITRPELIPASRLSS
jgi:hypothetical protein